MDFHGGGEGIIDFFIELAIDAYPSMTTLVVEIDAVLVRCCLPTKQNPTLSARGTNPRGSHPETSPISTKTKNRPHAVGFFRFLVEARGFEPLSEDNATRASTGVVTVLMSPEYRPVTGYALGQPDCLLQHTPGGDVTAYPTKS